MSNDVNQPQESGEAKLIFIDGNSIANRAFYALPLLSTAQGLHTNAVYGFCTMLLRLLEEEKPTHMLVAFDAGKVTFRHDEFSDYKAGRQKTPQELSEQFPLIKDVLEALAIPWFELPGYEADDIIGTLSQKAEEKGIPSLIVTGDRDLLQLVSPQVVVRLTRKGISEVEEYTQEHLEEVYGLEPYQIIDLKGLMGDSSDNIPGIPGVGEKTALKLLQQFTSVEEVLQNVEAISGKKLQEKVKENAEQARMSKRLATINRDAPISLEIGQLQLKPSDVGQIREVFSRLEMYSLLDRLSNDEEQGGEELPRTFEVHRVTGEDVGDWISRWQREPAVIHLEWVKAEPLPQIHGLMVQADGTFAYVDFALLLEEASLKEWLANQGAAKWMFDAKENMVVLSWYGIPLKGVTFDVLLASYLLNASEANHRLSDVALREGVPLPSDDSVYGKGAKWRQPEEGVLLSHLARKTDVMRQIVPKLQQRLEQDELLMLLTELELPLSSILAEMELTGIGVDEETLLEMGKELEHKLEQLKAEIYRQAGSSFNLNSPKQLGEILFDKLGLPVVKKTKTGYSTDAEVLERLAPQHEIVSQILLYRQLIKLHSTYIEGLLKVIHPQTGRIHTSLNQAITATGRLSSTEPNLQNIPIRLEEGRRIRKAFIPSQKDWLILSADYSQIELRVLAHISQDEALLTAFQEDLDVHTHTAAEIFEVSQEEVTSLMRRQAKAVNFGIVYGISDYGLSQNLNISRKEAAAFIERYFETFSGVRLYMDQVIQEAKKQGYVKTLLKRRRYLPEINSANYNLRSFAERTAMNTPIQGSAADIIKLAMVQLDEELNKRKLASRILLQVHDELILEMPVEERDEVEACVREIMENALPLNVPLKVDVHVGSNWYEAK